MIIGNTTNLMNPVSSNKMNCDAVIKKPCVNIKENIEPIGKSQNMVQNHSVNVMSYNV